MDKSNTTSWQSVGNWYGNLVGKEGHFFHQTVIIPKSLTLLNLNDGSKVLDIGCGNGILSRFIPKKALYTGIDIAPTLIRQAKDFDKNLQHTYLIADVQKPVSIPKNTFSHAVSILALQNMRDVLSVFHLVNESLIKSGLFLIVLNHPCFRIPRQSSWGIDESNKMQFRKINRYLSPLEIPINMHPGDFHSPLTWSFHHPLSEYSANLFKEGFVIEKIEEWVSEKTSVGKAAKMENRSREEFPLFMAILARKK